MVAEIFLNSSPPAPRRASRRTPSIALGVGLAVAWTAASQAATAIQLDMPAQSLSLTLKRVARAGSVELAFDRATTDRLRAPRLKGQYTVDQALAAALASSGLGVQRTSDGAYVIKPLAAPPPARPPADTGDGAVSEILVLGRRNLNTGIRRTRDDIQPYDVALEETIRNAGDMDVESFIRRTMPADAQAGSLAQAPAANNASARSRIDLLGLGGGQTLVLVDGRRLPSVPDAVGNGAGFVQADVNGVPLAAIERIEVLTAAAGALYGPGATGGVVNIILKRDYQGAEVGLNQGFTEHGGGQATHLDAAIGRTSDDGRSGLSVRIALAKDHGLDVGQRSYGERVLITNGANFKTGQTVAAYLPVGAGVNVSSMSGPLTLKPAYGGGALGSSITTFATSGFTAAEALANAGTLNLALAPDAFGEAQSLVTGTDRRSLIVSARHESGIFEGFFDYLLLDNRGTAIVPAGQAVLSIGVDSPYNPFEQAVYVARSIPWDGPVRNRSLTQRANLGLIARLPHGWMAEGDLSQSLSRIRMTNQARGATVYADLAVYGDDLGPGLSPFASEKDFVAAYTAYRVADGAHLKLSDTLTDANLRASGPLWRLPGGPLTMTMTAEASDERAPGGERVGFDVSSQASITVEGNRLDLATRSVYAEWRAPLGPANGGGPLRGLELQVALRADAYRIVAPQSNEVIGDDGPAAMSDAISKHTVFAKTLGLKTFLMNGVMARVSYSEGHLPPRSDQVQSLVVTYLAYPFFDPQRGGQLLGAAGPLQVIQGGSPTLDPEMARTFGAGVVIEPPWLKGTRLSIDYLRTDKSDEITDFASGSAWYFLSREALYPTRVVRAPLTDADRARGFTVGAVTLVDTTAMNVGRSIAETVDVSLNYHHALGGGDAAAYLRGVWQPSYRRHADPEQPWHETVGYSDGPLRVRAFAGVQWSADAFSAGLSARYYDGYAAEVSGFTSIVNNYGPAAYKGRIPSQTYLDGFVRWSFGRDRTQLQMGVRNLLDAAPPLVLASPMGYSTYGDAQGRSFQISLSRRF